MSLKTEKIANWLLAGLELKSTLFHVGQYCGTWQASTAGHRRASFHIVLHGKCWLHFPVQATRAAETVQLRSGDAVFLLHDMPHCLSSDPRPPSPKQANERIGTMTPFASRTGRADAAFAGGIGLACGFFEFRSELDDLLLALLPDYLVARRNDPLLDGARTIFDLIRTEALRSHGAPSPLIARLTDLLFFYALHAVAQRDEIAPGLWPLMRRAEFAPLVTAIIDAPGDPWTTHTMASFVHMSRARFCKQFAQLCGRPPAQFVTLIRMKVAATMLRAGATTPVVAEHVGYQSESAFAQAFKRVTGLQPGAYRRLRTEPDAQHLPARNLPTSAAAGAGVLH